MRILMLPGSQLAPAARFRIWQFVEPLRTLGHDVTVRVLFPERYWSAPGNSLFHKLLARLGSLCHFVSALWITRDIEKYDAVIMNRDLVPEIRIDFLEPWLAKRNPRLIFDFDDSIFLGAREKKMRKILPSFAAVTAGNKYLAKFARQCNSHVEIWPTVVDTERFTPAKARLPGPVRIGWSGSNSTLEYCLPLLQGVLTELTRTEHFEFLVIADEIPKITWPGVTLRFIPWSPETEVDGLQLFDIGLMPLKDEQFERGKCGAKAITYMAVGIPSLVSPVGVNSEIIVHRECGYHCRSEDEWLTALRLLINNGPLRCELGGYARKRVVEYYSTASLLPKMEKLFNTLFARNIPLNDIR